MNRFRILFLSTLLMLLVISACVQSYPLGLTQQPTAYNSLVLTIVAQTLTAWPSSTISPGLMETLTQTAALLPQTPKDFISYYFDNINSRNYERTWSLLSDRFKDRLNGSSQGGYQGYVNFWNSVKQATVKDVFYTCQGDLCAVDVSLQLNYYNGNPNISTYSYTLTYDHTRNTWMFDFIPVPTATASRTFTATHTRTSTPTATKTSTVTTTATNTSTLTQTASATPSQTPSATTTLPPSPTFTWTLTGTPTTTEPFTPTGTPTATPIATGTTTLTTTATASETPTLPPSETPTATGTTGP